MPDIKKINGKLSVRKNKKGEVLVFIEQGRTPLKIVIWKDPKQDYHGKEAELTIDGNRQIRLELLESGEVLAGENQRQNPDPPESENDHPDSFSIPHTMLPKTTREALSGLKDIDNFALKFYKGARFVEAEKKEDSKFMAIHTDKGEVKFCMKADFSNLDFKAIVDRQLSAAKALGYSDTDQTLVCCDATSDWRWVTGLGIASVYENGMALHHVYGIPCLPGSGIKGLMRTSILKECFNCDEDTAYQNSVFVHFFGKGNPDEEAGGLRGKTVFFDALPPDPKALEIAPDIINNHYQDYYEGNTPPADWHNPNPIFFMSVSKSKLRFCIGVKEGNKPAGKDALKMIPGQSTDINEDTSVAGLLKAWLKEVLQKQGAGAKTAAGYGRMSIT